MSGNLPGVILIGACAVIVMTWVAALALPRHRRRVIQRVCSRTAACVVGAFLVARGIAEFFLVNYSDPGSYRLDWGGPSLAGVFAVHSGPGSAVLIGTAVFTWRSMRSRGRLSVEQ